MYKSSKFGNNFNGTKNIHINMDIFLGGRGGNLDYIFYSSPLVKNLVARLSTRSADRINRQSVQVSTKALPELSPRPKQKNSIKLFYVCGPTVWLSELVKYRNKIGLSIKSLEAVLK
jgi:hypothetical protein